MARIPDFVGESKFTKDINSLIQSTADNNVSILALGEKGTGKKLFAMSVHSKCSKTNKVFFEVNFRLADEITVLGIFTKVTEAILHNNHVTLFLNCIDLCSKELQSKFVEFINSQKEASADIKIISSSENNLELMMFESGFDTKLYFQISSISLNFLPLRQRKEDIIPIAKLYLDQFRKESGFKFEDFSNEAKTKIEDNFWIGNADELINCVQRGFIVGQPPLIKAMDLGFERGAPLSDISTIETVQENKTLKFAIDSFKREYIKKILEENDWNQTKTAKILGIQRTYVIKLIEDLNIKN